MRQAAYALKMSPSSLNMSGGRLKKNGNKREWPVNE